MSQDRAPTTAHQGVIVPDGKAEESILRRKTREYPTEWALYPADDEQENARVQQEKEGERPPETSTANISYAPKIMVQRAH